MTTMRSLGAARYLALNLLALLVACGPTLEGEQDDDTDKPKIPEKTTGKQLVVSSKRGLSACSTCTAPIVNPNWSYQTPRTLHIGVAQIELLRDASDPHPHRLITAAPAIDVDLVQTATFAAVDTGSIPEGTYMLMRVTLDWMSYSVDAVGHAMTLAWPGTLDVDYAIADYVDSAFGPRAQGDYTARFSVFGQSITQTGVQSVNYPAPYPGATVDVSGAKYRVTFPPPTQPIVISHGRPMQVDIVVTFFIDDAFGWEDRSEPNFTAGVFDITADPRTTEQPKVMAIRGFQIDVR